MTFSKKRKLEPTEEEEAHYETLLKVEHERLASSQMQDFARKRPTRLSKRFQTRLPCIINQSNLTNSGFINVIQQSSDWHGSSTEGGNSVQRKNIVNPTNALTFGKQSTSSKLILPRIQSTTKPPQPNHEPIFQFDFTHENEVE